LLPRQAQTPRRQLRENINWIRNDEDDRVLAQSGRLDAIQYLREKRNVAIDQVQARFIGFAPKPSRDQEDIAIGSACIIAGINPLVRGESGAVLKVERFPVGHVFVGVQDLELRNDAATLQRECRAGTDASAATDNCDLH